MTVDEKLDQLALRQEALIAAIHGLVNVVETVRDIQAELLQGLTAAVQGNSEVLSDLTRRIEALPGQLAR